MATKEFAQAVQARIRQRMNEMGLNPRAASVASGLDETYLKKLFSRPGAVPKQEQMAKLAVGLETSVEWLEGRHERPRASAETTTNGEAPTVRIDPAVLAALATSLPPAVGSVPAAVLRSDIRGANIEFPALASMPTDVPVYGTAAGSVMSGAFQFEGGVVDYVRRPPGLAGDKAVYALYIEGASMEPEHRHGDLRFIHTGRPPRLGDSVIIQVRNHAADRIEGFIGRLLRKTGSQVFIGKLNPESTVQFKLEYVVAMHKVLTMNDLFGV